ncbi:MAG: DUF3592 domain-containing protein [Thermoguttaceae bacterium]
MARSFRFYEKKRGHRRTGSHILGSVGEAAFFAVLLLLGCAGLVAVFWWLVVPEWRVNHAFVRHSCQVLDKRVSEIKADKNVTRYRPEVRISYQIKGETYRAWAYDIHMAYGDSREKSVSEVSAFADGQTYPCWYDPANPHVVVLVRSQSFWHWLVFLVPASFLALGLAGLIYAILHWGRSVERRASMAQLAPGRDLFEPPGPARPQHPTIPDCTEITSSPGTRLAYRLPMSGSPAWTSFGLLLAALLWNAAVAVFVVQAIGSLLARQPDWLLTLFIIPFTLIGIALAVLFARHLLVTTGIGPTLVEISDHPLMPGGSYQLFISQSGQFEMNFVEVSLICQEQATYCQGTNSRTEIREIYRQSVLRREQLAAKRGEPFEAQCALDIPCGAMHSFKANHNEIHWKVLVRGRVAAARDYQRWFPVIVYPTPEKAHA